MSEVNKYLKIAKDAVIEPEGGIEDKIIDRISHIKEKDKNLLDESFKDFFDKNNSRPYLVGEKIKDHPGTFSFAVVVLLGIFAVSAYFLNMLISNNKKSG
ncbi:MAG: hypothetical protein V3R31_06310 [Candidatus Humimicrobiaceae bacterium]